MKSSQMMIQETEDVPSEKSDNELSDYEEIEGDNYDLEYVPSSHVVASSYYLPPPVHDVHESYRSDYGDIEVQSTGNVSLSDYRPSDSES
jgi:hypothetical protein